MNEKVSICIPTYNTADTVKQTIQSVLAQTFRDFELVIVDNASIDNTASIVKSVKDSRIKFFINSRNLGCGGNLEECKRKAMGDILIYIAADDVLDVDAVQRIYDAFMVSGDIGVVTRPYYWFVDSVSKAVRATKQFKKDHTVSINSSYEEIRDVIALADQTSGLGFRKKYMVYPFGQEPFIEASTLISKMLKGCKIIIIKENIVAVRIGKNGSMNISVYKKSPLLSWFNVINTVYPEKTYECLRDYLIKKFVSNNFIGLIQIKNFGNLKYLIREIKYLIKFNWLNIFNIKFWFFSIGTIIIPRFILKKAVKIYKDRVNSLFLKNISIKLK